MILTPDLASLISQIHDYITPFFNGTWAWVIFLTAIPVTAIIIKGMWNWILDFFDSIKNKREEENDIKYELKKYEEQ